MPYAIRTHSQDNNLVNLRREQIARGASRIFVRKGYTNANIRAIAKSCHMSIGSLYHYIGAKDDILYLVFDYALSRETEFIENASTTHSALSPTEALREAIKAYYGIVDDIQDMVVFMYQETKSLRSSAREHVFEQERRIIAVFEAILARGCESGEFKIKDIATVSNDIVIMGDAWAFRRWLLKRHYTIQEFTRQQTTFILEGILGEDRYP